ncbi:uncharacterized protein [Cherax quadricarinatus]
MAVLEMRLLTIVTVLSTVKMMVRSDSLSFSHGEDEVEGVGEAGQVVVYRLHTEAPPWEGLTWVQREVSFPGVVTHLTVCLHFRILFLYTDPAILLRVDGTHFAAIYEGNYALFNSKYFWWTQKVAKLRLWRHMCFLMGEEAGVGIEGRYLPGVRQGDQGQPTLFVGSRNLTLGVPAGFTDLTTMGPVGAYYTPPRVFFRKLSEDELLALATCTGVPEGEVLGEEDDNGSGGGEWKIISTHRDETNPRSHHQLHQHLHSHYQHHHRYQEQQPGSSTGASVRRRSWDSDSYEPHNLTGHSSESWPGSPAAGHSSVEEVLGRVEARVVCSPRPTRRYLLVAADRHTYYMAERLCAIYGGTLPPSLTEDMLEATRELMTELPNMMLFAWIKSSGVNSSSCRSVSLQPLEAEALDMSVSCSHLADKLLCQVPWSSPIELRHNGPAGADDLFFLEPRGIEPRFFSPRGRQISSPEPESLALHDYEGALLATATMSTYKPMGRHLWRDAHTNTTKTMVLTVCKQEEFTCNDGWCIPLSSRCNGVNDCGDDSDELCSVLLPLPSSYRADRSPLPRTPLALTAKLVRVHHVDVVNNHITAWLQLNTQWRDGRVLLSQLSETSLDNILPEETVWSPRYSLTNAVFHDRVSYAQHRNSFLVTFASRVTRGKVDCIDGYEGYVYNGSTDAILERQENFMAACICDFDLTNFPFDVHECHINISIINRGTFHSTFEPQSIWIKSEPSTLTLFQASELRYVYQRENGSISTISFRVLLSRQFGAYLLTTFLPCWILGIIGFTTLYFRTSDFSERISVTLSCLIVIAALYSQITFTIPQSSSPKVIDVYFFYFIVRLFKTFAHHSVLYLLENRRKKREERQRVENGEVSTTENGIHEVSERDLDGDTSSEVESTDINTVLELKYVSSISSQKTLAKIPSPAPKKPPPQYDRIFNLAGITWGIGTDFIFISAFSYWILSSRQRVINTFEESLV